MLTRIEINGFKTFEGFSLDLRPFSAIVGPNASGKSNLFDALKLLSLLSQFDIRTAMQDLRGEPEELFRVTRAGTSPNMSFAIEVLLNLRGTDQFGTKYDIKAQRLRYELELSLKSDARGQPKGLFVVMERCEPIAKKNERQAFTLSKAKIKYSSRTKPFISMREGGRGESNAFEIRQDGPTENGPAKRGRPITIPATEASRTALSTITTAEFPHLYALRELFLSTRFLEINPQSARKATDRFEAKVLKADASNLASVLARLKDETATDVRPDGVINDISSDLASLIPSVKSVDVFNEDHAKEYSFGISTAEDMSFSSRVISDGTLRVLALLSILDDPNRKGILCFEEPENGVHEGRIDALIEFLRASASNIDTAESEPLFQVLTNTHSPAVMKALEDFEIVAADSVSVVDVVTHSKTTKTRMRTGVVGAALDIDPENQLTRQEVLNILRRTGNEA